MTRGVRGSTPPPSWEVFDGCPRCGARAGGACVDMRGVPKGYYPNCRAGRELGDPHHGRRKVRK